ncbi:aspartate/glutamate racemase family protein [Paenibacillus sp. PAMC21692]|uniref:aspartate/glutamate racemase family protein n=1 Tax=Paenibacillus sp. PAMC21692 TaxID=2762320 RepID=UPI00164D0F12|nr:amino acid racemase [Paenibacillus sp. PAMC21692]QNK58227.1 aspartate/glutamate racemase family protein [Paenibacillus sp. PAMC21692]
MEQKSLGVIGGMGPKATAVFFDKVIENTAADRDQEHLDMIILNHATAPDRTAVILEGKDELFLEAITKDLRLLELAGVSHIAIPCNTSHYFYDKMQAMTSIPIINMVEETIKLIHDRFGAGSRIGILATNGTIRSGIYAKVCEQYGMNLYEHDERIQTKSMKIIYENVKSNMDFSPEELEELIDELVTAHGCHCVILACTELSCIKLSRHAAEVSVDAMQVLVEKSILLSGKQVKNSGVS